MAQEERTSDVGKQNSPGPYLAKVVSHLDNKFMGGLQVELLKLNESGNNQETAGQVIEARYMSPFYGVTPLKAASNNEGYAYTQKSYGMWAVPPDVGTTVVVIFIEGNPQSAYWIGCVQEEYMNFMIPGKASTKFNSADTSKMLPVGEYNKRTETGAGRTPTKFIKPVDTDRQIRLTRAGLINDPIRGTNTSSARREAPSQVYGWSTPGPVDKRPGAPTTTYGTQGSQINIPSNRLGGHSFVMDDGDMAILKRPDGTYANTEKMEMGGDPTKPQNECMRLLTRTGHQILLHNTEDLIYIGHGTNDTWIELDKDNVKIYAAGDVRIESGDNISLKAGGDINLEAAGSINLNSDSTRTKDLNVNGGIEASATVAAATVTATNVEATHPHLLSGGRAGTPAPVNNATPAELQGSNPSDDTFAMDCT